MREVFCTKCSLVVEVPDEVNEARCQQCGTVVQVPCFAHRLSGSAAEDARAPHSSASEKPGRRVLQPSEQAPCAVPNGSAQEPRQRSPWRVNHLVGLLLILCGLYISSGIIYTTVASNRRFSLHECINLLIVLVSGLALGGIAFRWNHVRKWLDRLGDAEAISRSSWDRRDWRIGRLSERTSIILRTTIGMISLIACIYFSIVGGQTLASWKTVGPIWPTILGLLVLLTFCAFTWAAAPILLLLGEEASRPIQIGYSFYNNDYPMLFILPIFSLSIAGLVYISSGCYLLVTTSRSRPPEGIRVQLSDRLCAEGLEIEVSRIELYPVNAYQCEGMKLYLTVKKEIDRAADRFAFTCYDTSGKVVSRRNYWEVQVGRGAFCLYPLPLETDRILVKGCDEEIGD